jgi:nucleotide-binding universal stress UspA family protein
MTGIVVGVDRSAESAAALLWASEESRLRQVPLEVLLAWGYLDQYQGRDKFEPHYDGHEAQDALDAFVARSLPDLDLTTVKRTAVDGFAADVLVDASTSADLLVVGPRGQGGFLGIQLGSVSERCVDHAHCPTVVARRRPDRRAGDRPCVAVGVDGSGTSVPALAWAATEARRRGAELRVVHAWFDPTEASSAIIGTPSTFRRATERTVDRLLGHVDLTGVTVRCSFVEGQAGSALADASRQADLIVVGTRGLRPFQRAFARSVMHDVVRHACCSVVVVRPPSA